MNFHTDANTTETRLSVADALTILFDPIVLLSNNCKWLQNVGVCSAPYTTQRGYIILHKQ